MLLLDTHVWYWAITDDSRRLGRRTRRLLARAGSDNNVLVSVVSVFELVALHALGRIRLDRAPQAWIREALDVAGVRLAELTSDAAIDAGGIPREVLPDPLDRLLIATARRSNAMLVTADERILQYAAGRRDVQSRDARL